MIDAQTRSEWLLTLAHNPQARERLRQQVSDRRRRHVQEATRQAWAGMGTIVYNAYGSTVACSNCEAPFVVKHSTQLYCTPKCRSDAHKDRNRNYKKEQRNGTPTIRVDTCPECGNQFETRYRIKTYCTKTCANRAGERARRPNCNGCGRVRTGTRQTQTKLDSGLCASCWSRVPSEAKARFRAGDITRAGLAAQVPGALGEAA